MAQDVRINLFGIGTQSESRAITAQRRINCLVSPQTEMDRTAFALIGRPGLDAFVTTLGNNPSRGMWAVNSLSTPLLFSVHGSSLVSVDNSGTVSTIGTINTSTGDVSMVDNGTYLVLVDGTDGWYYDMVTPGTLTQIASGNFTSSPITVDYQDTYFIVTSGSSRQFQLSNNDDPTTWAALDIGFADSGQGTLKAGYVNNNILQLFGSNFVEFRQNTGTADLPYQRIPGASQNFGLLASWSMDEFDNSLTGLMGNRQGSREISRMNGFARTKLSDGDIDDLLLSYTTVSDATGYSMMFGGHPLYVINFPTPDVTHVYDGLGHSWTEWQATDGTRFWGNKFAILNNRSLVSDRRNGNIYEFNTATYTDNGDEIPFEVISKHLWEDDKYITVNDIQIDMEQGVGTATGQGADPHIDLQVSKDYGFSFTSVGYRSVGKVGEYTTRVRWQALGAARDWVFKLRITDPVKRVITGASADISIGSS